MNVRARHFLSANAKSPVVYGGVDGRCVTYRLADGSVFRLTTDDLAEMPPARWVFERHSLLERVCAEATMLEWYPEGGRA